MENVYVDIRKENETIREYFYDKDFVSIDTLLNSIDDLLFQIEKMKEEKEPDEDIWNKYDMQYLREMEDLDDR